MNALANGSARRWRLGARMYHVTDAVADAWDELMQALVAALRESGWSDPMQVLRHFDDLSAFWTAPDMLFGQTCGYPLVTALRGHVHVLGTPVFDMPHCDGARYSSLLMVREDSGLSDLQALRGKRAGFNGPDSHSGMNALRHSVAKLALQGRFFGSVLATGGHRESLQALQDGRIDVAAIDCVHHGYARREAPERLVGLRVLHVSALAPGLPFIASKQLGQAEVDTLRGVLMSLPAAHPALAARLAIRSIAPMTQADYEPILDMERQAAALGYPTVL